MGDFADVDVVDVLVATKAIEAEATTSAPAIAMRNGDNTLLDRVNQPVIFMNLVCVRFDLTYEPARSRYSLLEVLLKIYPPEPSGPSADAEVL